MVKNIRRPRQSTEKTLPAADPTSFPASSHSLQNLSAFIRNYGQNKKATYTVYFVICVSLTLLPINGDLMDCFKAYDIRGTVPEQLNDDVAYRIGRAYALETGAKTVCVGHDVRQSSRSLTDALSKGLADGGVDVLDIGLCGTEEIYFTTFHDKLDGGIMVTASHNPMNYNGMKLVREESRPISGDTGLFAIRDLAAKNEFPPVEQTGTIRKHASRSAYIDHLLEYISPESLKPLKVVANSGNGCAGPVLDLLAKQLPCNFVMVQHEPDGTFPNGIPNPLLPEKRDDTANAVQKHGADIGLAWDGDFDRCFLFDEKGRFIEGYYIVGLLAAALLERNNGAKIIHDPRLTWNTVNVVTQHGGIPVESKTGHAFIKERMRAENAVYGGEMSAHHYFRDFAYCDSGMITCLLVLELMSRTGKTLSALVDEMMKQFPCSGEINRRVTDAQKVMATIRSQYESTAKEITTIDGLSMDCGNWRFNLRSSNTEPVIRLNVESRGDEKLMLDKTNAILAAMDPFSKDAK